MLYFFGRKCLEIKTRFGMFEKTRVAGTKKIQLADGQKVIVDTDTLPQINFFILKIIFIFVL